MRFSFEKYLLKDADRMKSYLKHFKFQWIKGKNQVESLLTSNIKISPVIIYCCATFLLTITFFNLNL